MCECVRLLIHIIIIIIYHIIHILNPTPYLTTPQKKQNQYTPPPYPCILSVSDSLSLYPYCHSLSHYSVSHTQMLRFVRNECSIHANNLYKNTTSCSLFQINSLYLYYDFFFLNIIYTFVYITVNIHSYLYT
jgi:hypothetical protein